MSDALQTIVDFLTSIGIRVRTGSVPADAFLPGLRIVDGGLIFDPAALRWPGDLLHEAGHIATVPSALRPILNDALADAPTSPHGGEAEATRNDPGKLILWPYDVPHSAFGGVPAASAGPDDAKGSAIAAAFVPPFLEHLVLGDASHHRLLTGDEREAIVQLARREAEPATLAAKAVAQGHGQALRLRDKEGG